MLLSIWLKDWSSSCESSMSKISAVESSISLQRSVSKVSKSMGLVVNLFSVGGVWGAERPVCASSESVQGTLLVEHTPGDAAAIQTDVTVADTHADDLIAWFTNKVDTKVEELGEHFRGLELHGLNLLPENSSNNVDHCSNSENKTPHILVEFCIVNLLQSVDQSISRGKGFGEVHVKKKNCEGGWEIAFLNHQISMAHARGSFKGVCATSEIGSGWKHLLPPMHTSWHLRGTSTTLCNIP